ncbi:hypothetical protein N8778_02955 [Verrucomicrobia bacterium]|nr:hypothetical protein [Verrucomicrobiota bacterium]
MPKFTCVFVEQDKETIFEGANARQLDADSPKSAAIAYKDIHKSIGPYVRVRDENGHNLFFKVDDFFKRTPEEIEATKKELAEAKQAAQSSLSSTDLLLKELIKEQKSANGKIDRIYWLLLVLTGVAIMPIYRLLKKWDSL